jgi:hypothetical protein
VSHKLFKKEMHVTIADTEAFRAIIAALRVMSTGANVFVTQEGLTIQALNEMTNASTMTARFSRDAFSMFRCVSDESFFISLKYFSNAFKLIPKGGTVTLRSIASAKLEISFAARGETGDGVTVCMTTANADRELLDASSIHHPGMFTAPASFFASSSIIHNASDFVESCAFYPQALPDSPPCLVMRCVSNTDATITSGTVSFSPKAVTVNVGEGIDTGVCYKLSELKKLSSIAVDNPGNVRVCFGAREPLIVLFTLKSGCAVEYLIAPCEEDENEDPEANLSE